MRCFIGLGGNLGKVEVTFRAALDHLHATPDVAVSKISSFHRTVPMGNQAGGSFLNAVAELDAGLEPIEILDLLQSVERRCGRTRETHWGPRTLDLDLLIVGGVRLSHPRLTLPHPGCWYRRFVLDPFVEIAPDFIHPVKRVSFGDLRDRLLPRPLKIGLAGGNSDLRDGLTCSLAKAFPAANMSAWHPGDEDPAILFWLGANNAVPLDFDDLPVLPRLDLTSFPEGLETAGRNVLTAALGES